MPRYGNMVVAWDRIRAEEWHQKYHRADLIQRKAVPTRALETGGSYSWWVEDEYGKPSHSTIYRFRG